MTPRALRRRGLAHARPRRAHLPLQRAYRLLIHGPLGDAERLVRPHVPGSLPGHRRRRWAHGLRERGAVQLAVDEGAEMRLPPILPG